MQNFINGRLAARRGYPKTDNPHTPHTPEWNTWNSGWETAIAEAQQ